MNDPTHNNATPPSQDLIRGERVRAGHKSTLLGVLGSDKMVDVESVGSTFKCQAFFPWRLVVGVMVEWSAKNPGKTPGLAEYNDWAVKINSHHSIRPRITLAETGDLLSRRAYLALIGGGYHEAWHRLYTSQSFITGREIQAVLAPRWAGIEWHKYANFLQEMENILEDIRIERVGNKEFPGAYTKMCDLQDFILGKELPARMEFPILSPTRRLVKVVMNTIRDIGLGYNTDAQRSALDFYKLVCPEGVALVLTGPLAPIVKRTISAAKDDVTWMLAGSMDALRVLSQTAKDIEQAQSQPQGNPNPQSQQKGKGKPQPQQKSQPSSPDSSSEFEEPQEPQESEDGSEGQSGKSKSKKSQKDKPEKESKPEKSKKESKPEKNQDPEDSDENSGGDSDEDSEDGEDSKEDEKSQSKGKGKDSKEDQDEEDQDGEGSGNDDEESDEEGSDDESDEDSKGESEDESEDEPEDESDEGTSGESEDESKDQSDEGDSEDESKDASDEEDSEDEDSKDGESGEDDEDDSKDESEGEDSEDEPKTDEGEHKPSNSKNEDKGGEGGNSSGGGQAENTAKNLLEAYEKGEKADLLDNNSALTEELKDAQDREDKTQQKDKHNHPLERPYRPLSTDRDRIIMQTSTEADRAAVDKILKSVKSITSYLRSHMRNMFRAMETVGRAYGVPKGQRLSERDLVDTIATIRSGQDPRRAFVEEDVEVDNSMAAAVVLDESGSMRSLAVETRRGLLAVCEALDNLGCKTQVAGFQSGQYGHEIPENEGYGNYHRTEGIDHHVFKTFDERFDTIKGRFNALRSSGGTPMADGLQFALDSLNTRREAHKVVFVFTDGCPDGGHEMVMRGQIRRSTEAGVLVIGVGLGSGAEYVKHTFPDSVYAPSLDALPKLLVDKLRTLVKNQIKVGTTKKVKAA